MMRALAAENNKKTQSALGIFATEVRDEAAEGHTMGKVNSALAPAVSLLNARTGEISSAMAANGGGGAPATEGSEAPAPAPAPPAPAPDAQIPDIALISRINSEKSTIQVLKANVQKDVEENEKMKTEAMKGISVANQYKLGLKTQDKELAVQEADATKDISEIKASKEQISQGGKDIGAKRGVRRGRRKESRR